MYKVKWDSKINGILLDDKINDKEEIVPPRPVFYEELDLLGFNKYWSYPKKKEPLLWAIGRRYYNKGVFVAEAKGGNIYESPELIVEQKVTLEPIDVKLIIEKNEASLFIVENEAMDFVEYVHKKYKDKVDYFAVAFSGGKDSQVVLDIVSRVLAPDDYMVIFTDTTMEIPFTYETVKKTKDTYQRAYPELKFYTAKPPRDALEFWEQFGPPSRIHRWCCSVCKTAPFARFIKKLHKKNDHSGQPKILVFEGARTEESNKRSQYKRLVKGLKHSNQINGRLILDWSISEVFLYLFRRNINLNTSYRHGLHRVGCSICPFTTGWSEHIINCVFPQISNRFLRNIENTLINSGMKDNNRIKKYILEGQWKKRGGGKYLNTTNGTGVDFIQEGTNLKSIIRNPKESFLEWLNLIGRTLYKSDGQKIIGEIKIDNELFNFDIKSIENNITIIDMQDVGRDIISQSKLKKIIYKTTYCVHCGVCEAECPTGALQVIPKVEINKNLCVHCSKCLNFTDRGCLIARSLTESEGGNNMKTKYSNPDRYSGFGIRAEWLEAFLNNPDEWIDNNHLGVKQIKAMKVWLKESSLIDLKNNPLELATILNNIKLKNYILIWELIWVNLSYNSSIVRWYLNVKFSNYTKRELQELIKIDFPSYKERTLNNYDSK